jgi:hypothetical protein
MIYKIYSNQLTEELINDNKFIMFSFDGQYALIRSESTFLNALEQHEETQLKFLYADLLYRQPCKDC